MAKDFSFPFYINNWLGGTMGWTLLQKGAYLELLLFQFQNDSISPENIRQLLGADYDKLWKFLEKKFKKNRDGCFYNEKMRLVMAERKAFTESRRRNRLGKTKITSEKQVLFTSKTSEKHMESESEDEIKSEILYSIEKVQEYFLNDYEIQQMVCSENKFDLENLVQAMTEFWNTRKLMPEATEKPYSDTKRHFLNWCRQNKARIKGLPKNGQKSKHETLMDAAAEAKRQIDIEYGNQ